MLVLGFATIAGARPDGGSGRGAPGNGGAGGSYAAASEEFELGTKLVVTLEGVSVVVSVDDVGPVDRGVDLGLSGAAAEEIGLPPGGGTAVVDVMVANPEAPLGPLSTSGGGSVSSSVVSTATQVNGESSRSTHVRLVVDGVEIADSEVVEMVATSAGRVQGGPRASEGQYVESQYAEGEASPYQYQQYRYDALQYDPEDQAHLDGNQYDAFQYAENDDARTSRAGSDEEDAPASPVAVASVEDEPDDSGASGRRAGDTVSGTDEASSVMADGEPVHAGKEDRSRTSGAGLERLEQLPATGGLTLAGALWASLLPIGLGALLVRWRGVR